MLGSFLAKSQFSGHQTSHFAEKETEVPRRNVLSPRSRSYPRALSHIDPAGAEAKWRVGDRAEAESWVCGVREWCSWERKGGPRTGGLGGEMGAGAGVRLKGRGHGGWERIRKRQGACRKGAGMRHAGGGREANLGGPGEGLKGGVAVEGPRGRCGRGTSSEAREVQSQDRVLRGWAGWGRGRGARLGAGGGAASQGRSSRAGRPGGGAGEPGEGPGPGCPS